MSKGSTTRVKNRTRFEINKERAFMDTHKLGDLLGLRLREEQDDEGKLDDAREAVYQRFVGLAYDLSIMPQGDKSEGAKQIRREILAMHKELDDMEEQS